MIEEVQEKLKSIEPQIKANAARMKAQRAARLAREKEMAKENKE